jgi:hypothetical protein
MSFLDSLKSAAHVALDSTATALHAQLANTLSQAGHDVTEDDHVDVLVSAAVSAAAAFGKPAGTVAPNTADHALAAFDLGMHTAMMAFASHFLPAKFQPLAAAAVDAVGDVVDAVKAGDKAAIVNEVADLATAATAVLAPAAAPFVQVAAEVAHAVVDPAEAPAAPAAPAAE